MAKKKTQKGYKTTSWSGRVQYKCEFCQFDSFDEIKMLEHLIHEHDSEEALELLYALKPPAQEKISSEIPPEENAGVEIYEISLKEIKE